MAGIIHRADPTGKWQSKVFVVPKATPGQFRIVVDFRDVNTQLVLKHAPLKPIQELLSEIRASGADCFSSSDIQHAFFNISYELEDTEPTAFYADCGPYTSTWGESLTGRWEQSRAIMGAQPSTFSLYQALSYVLEGVAHFQIYVDDLFLYTIGRPNQLKVINEVLENIKQNRLKIASHKANLMKDTIDFMGYTINGNFIKPMEDKLKTLKDYPTTEKEIRSFLGFVNFFHSFIPNFTYHASTLTTLLRKNSVWKPETDIPDNANLPLTILKTLYYHPQR